MFDDNVILPLPTTIIKIHKYVKEAFFLEIIVQKLIKLSFQIPKGF